MDDAAPRPPQFGFVIDQRKCIGCHACTVACKAENEVPVGQFRTWVKYVERGAFPTVRRHFTVLRCNHCDRAPCVEICPVNALSKRPDAIVDLDKDQCIGCRACMQACPYDALYLNEDTGTAEKCHYCAHRTELGLEPACVVVCPERAILAGDVADGNSEIGRTVRDLPTSQRRVEKGTRPRVWYVDALPEALDPGRPAEPPIYLWSDRPQPQPAVPQGFEPPPDLTTTLDVGHPPQWGWHIWTYLLTKNVSAGVAMAAPSLAALGVAPGFTRDLLPELLAAALLGVTLFLLVHDLGRPERFLKLLLQPNTKSWLVRGAWVLGGFGALLAASVALRLLGQDAAAEWVRLANLPVAALASGYSAWLFRQCRGRDLWLDPSLFLHLVNRAALVGGLFAAAVVAGGRDALWPATVVVACFVNLTILERRKGLDTEHYRRAHAILTGDARFRLGRVLLALAAILVTVSVPLPGAAVPLGLVLAACGLALHGLLLQERAWVEAGQAVPIS